MARRIGRLQRCLKVRGDCSLWDVECDGIEARALAYASLTGPLRPEDQVLLNATAVELRLGTGGNLIVICRCGEPPADEQPAAFPGREAGHVLKLRYTPLQHRILAVEEEASPHREAILEFQSLDGLPVLGAELLSQAGAAAVAARSAAPDLRIVFIQLDSAALPLSFSYLVSGLREAGVLNGTVTVGQSFGGDMEAVNVYTGLIAARAALGAELVIVSQGPGNAGTDTPYGFSGMSLVEAFHAGDLLGGNGVFVPRLSDADARPRHRGVSHHTRTLLRSVRVPLTVPLPEGAPDLSPLDCLPGVEHTFPRLDPSPAWKDLERHGSILTTMGRPPCDDPLFFRAAAAAGLYAAGVACARRGTP